LPPGSVAAMDRWRCSKRGSAVRRAPPPASAAPPPQLLTQRKGARGARIFA
jgi:hypothetical protein